MSIRTRIVDASVPSIQGNKVSMTYTIKGAKEVTERVKLEGSIAKDTILLPDHKRDAIAFAGIIDAVQFIIGQAIRSDMTKHRAKLSAWSQALKLATDNGEAGKVIGFLRSKPEKPELSDETSEFIGPFVKFLDTAKAAWQSAKRHTLSVYGTGDSKAEVVWTGTLSSLVGKKPAKGAIALGRKVR